MRFPFLSLKVKDGLTKLFVKRQLDHCQERTGDGICGEVDQSERIVSSDDSGSPTEVSIDEITEPGHLVGANLAPAMTRGSELMLSKSLQTTRSACLIL